jgi:microcystin-dependent protein
MAIKLRTDQSVELTYQEADENFSSLFYSASISGNTLSLYYTGSSFAPTTNPVNIAIPTSEGTRWTASLGGSITRSSDVSVVGSISATGAVTGSAFKVVGGTSGQILVANGTTISAGSNITISGGTISATDTNTTYTAGTGLSLTGTTFALADQPLHYKKMVPYTVVEYYGSLTAFDSTGAGTGDWVKIYLCNGNNGTPDKRGVVGVGVTDGSMKGGTMAAAVAPGGGNPTYTFNTITGANTVTLTVNQMPAHDHAGSSASSVTSAHSHLIAAPGGSATLTSTNTMSQGYSTSGNLGYSLVGTNSTPTIGRTSATEATTTTTVTLASQGGGQAHSNYQPGLGCYYIMYIPS